MRREHFPFGAEHGVEARQCDGCEAILPLPDGHADGLSGVPFLFFAPMLGLPFPAGNTRGQLIGEIHLGEFRESIFRGGRMDFIHVEPRTQFVKINVAAPCDGLHEIQGSMHRVATEFSAVKGLLSMAGERGFRRDDALFQGAKRDQ